MIKQNISSYEFVSAFNSSDNYKNNFSQVGLFVLYDYLFNLSEDIEEDIEFDIVCICCEYTEYENLAELKNDYPNIKSMEDLENHTQVIKFEEDQEGFIIQQF